MIKVRLFWWGAFFSRCAWRTIWIASLLITTAFASISFGAVPEPARVRAQRLVLAAAQAEVGGDTSRHLSLLHDALRTDPDNQLARWQLGEVRLDNKWVTVEEAQRRAAADPLQTEYRQRRSAAGPSLQAQLTLARWCRKSKLDDESQFHWATVLSLQPTNEEALRAADLRWNNGQLVSRNETAKQKQQAQDAKDAVKRWEPIIAKWRRAVAGRDVPAHDAALVEIRAINKLDAIPSIETVTLGRDAFDMRHAEECLQIVVAFLDALEKMPDQAATESLVRHAVFSPGNKARALAIEKLNLRDQYDYVPLLLSGLAMPLESSFNVHRNSDGSVNYTHTLYREGQDVDWSFDLRLAAVQCDLGGRRFVRNLKTNTIEVGPPTGADPSELAKRDKVSSRYVNQYSSTAAATESQVAESNQNTEALNTLITQVLTGATGRDYATPKAWWDWWRDQNEYYASGEQPVDQHYYSGTDKRYYGFPSYESVYPRPSGTTNLLRRISPSCFAKGTPVWTKTGPKPIETLELGDLVLAQHVSTGELKYKPLIGRTVRPPSPLLKISLDNEQLRTTMGHPFWVAGTGWRMAKELGEDAVLHGVTGSSRIQSIESASDDEAYNLVVADFNTYFVGETGVLVHDNTPRRSVPVVIPGIAK